MGSEWREWDLATEARFRVSDPKARAAIAEAQRAERGQQLRQIEVPWVVALDDASYQPPPESSHFFDGSPSHVHTEFEVEGDRVHIDRLRANKYAPGRSFTEFRIFVNGELRGRGGSAGSSLEGHGNADLPAVALVGIDTVLTVDRESTITLWRREFE
jgi:hypothetical protein